MEKDLRPWGRTPRSHIWHPPARRADGPSARPSPPTRGLGRTPARPTRPALAPVAASTLGPSTPPYQPPSAPRGLPGRRRGLAIVAGSWHSRCRGAPRQHLRAAVSHTLANACGGAPGGIRTHDPRFRNTVFLAAGHVDRSGLEGTNGPRDSVRSPALLDRSGLERTGTVAATWQCGSAG